MSVADITPNVEVSPYAAQDAVWERHEAERLSHMDVFLAGIAAADLNPVIDTIRGEHPDGVKLLDIGAASGTTVEDISDEKGVRYYPLDVNEAMLRGRNTPDGRKILTLSNAMGVRDGAFDVTFSRAATAWSSNPKISIAEQLRVTDNGGFAIFSEFDWTDARTDQIDTSAGRAFNGVKTSMQLALAGLGFRPEYGERLGADIDLVARMPSKGQRLAYSRYETRHALPPGDYRELLLSSAEELRNGLAGLTKGMPAVIHTTLERHMRTIENAPDSFEFTLPTVVTNVVEVMGRSEDSLAELAA